MTLWRPEQSAPIGGGVWQWAFFALRFDRIRDWCLRVRYCHHNARVIADFEHRMSRVICHCTKGMSKPYYTAESMVAEIDDYIQDCNADAVREALEDRDTQASRDRQREALAWAIDMFGPIAKNLDERALRLVEEAVEFAQAENVSKEVMLRLVERVYSRPAGDPVAELGAVALTMELAAEGRGVSAVECAENEFRRVKSKTREHFAKRHAAKTAEGIANLSPIG